METFATLRHLIVWLFQNQPEVAGRKRNINGSTVKWIAADVRRFVEANPQAFATSDARVRKILNDLEGEGLVDVRGHGSGGHAKTYRWVGEQERLARIERNREEEAAEAMAMQVVERLQGMGIEADTDCGGKVVLDAKDMVRILDDMAKKPR